MFTRRSLIGGTAAAAVGAVTVGCQPDRRADRTADDAAFDPRSWASVKAQFPLAKGYARFGAFVFSCHPEPVRRGIARVTALLDRDPLAFVHEENVHDTNLRRAAADFLGGEPDQIAFTDSTTAGLGLLYTGLKLAPGDEILTTEHDFYATHESLRLRAERTGAVVRKVRLYAKPVAATEDEMVSALAAALTPRVKVVALTWVHSSTGVRLPVRRLVDAVRARSDALVCLDAVHGFGAVDIRPGDLGVDFFVSGCHKWLFGPRGTGLIWGTRAAWARYTPVIPSFDGAAIGPWLLDRPAPPTSGPVATPGGYHTFEYRYALADAFGFHGRIGPARVAERTAALATRLKAGLAGMDHVTLHTPGVPALSAGIVCCEMRGVRPGDAVRRLYAAKVEATATPYRDELLRFGTSLATDEADVDAALAAVRTLR